MTGSVKMTQWRINFKQTIIPDPNPNLIPDLTHQYLALFHSSSALVRMRGRDAEALAGSRAWKSGHAGLVHVTRSRRQQLGRRHCSFAGLRVWNALLLLHRTLSLSVVKTFSTWWTPPLTAISPIPLQFLLFLPYSYFFQPHWTYCQNVVVILFNFCVQYVVNLLLAPHSDTKPRARTLLD